MFTRKMIACLGLALCLGASTRAQDASLQKDNRLKCDQQCAEAVRAWIEIPNFRADYQERENREMGDRIAVAIRKIYSEADLADTERVRSIFRVIRTAFEHPESLDPTLREPDRSISLLKDIRGKLTGQLITMDIDQLIMTLKAANSLRSPAQSFEVPCEDWRVAPFTVVGFAYLDTASLEVELRGGQMYMSKSGGRTQPTVVIRNHTGKPIRWLSLMVVRLGGGGSKGGQIRLENDLADGAEVRIGSDCKNVKPFTKDEFIGLGLHDDRLITTVVFGIDELGFSDGTSVKLNQTDRFWDFADRLYVSD